MKTNDTVPVYIAGQVVANATVKEVGDGTATLVVPATLVVMATRTELTVETPKEDGSGTETIITGIDRPSGGAAAESATGSENPSIDTNGTISGDASASTVTAESVTIVTPAAPVEAPGNKPADSVPESKENASNEG